MALQAGFELSRAWLLFGGAGALVALLLTGDVVRSLVWALAWALGARWTVSGVRQMAMTC
jgi:hypothetical protein